MVIISFTSGCDGYHIIYRWLLCLPYHSPVVAIVTTSFTSGCYGYHIILQWLLWLPYHTSLVAISYTKICLQWLPYHTPMVVIQGACPAYWQGVIYRGVKGAYLP